MTKDAKLKRVVRRHAQETGQRYTEALMDLEELGARMHHVHQPVGAQLLVHLRDHYGIDAVAATRLGTHHPYVFRIDRNEGDPWVARAFPPARPRLVPRATLRSCGSSSDKSFRLSGWPLMLRCRTSKVARSS